MTLTGHGAPPRIVCKPSFWQSGVLGFSNDIPDTVGAYTSGKPDARLLVRIGQDYRLPADALWGNEFLWRSAPRYQPLVVGFHAG